MLTTLKQQIPVGSTLDLSDPALSVPASVLAKYCGRTVYVGVMLDIYDQLREVNQMNNVDTVEIAVTGCQG